MLQQRILFGFVMIAAVIGLVWLDDWLPSAHGAPVGIIVCTLLVPPLVWIGSGELHRLLKSTGADPLWVWPALCAVLLAETPFLVRNGWMPGGAADQTSDLQMTLVLLVGFVIGTFVAVGARGRTEGAIRTIGASLFAALYIGLLLSFAVRIRIWPPVGGAWLLLYFIGTVKMSDIGAYFTGRFLGRHKLIEWLSPRKTIEGAVGGIALSTIVAVVVPVLIRQYGPERYHDVFPALGWSIAFGVAMAVLGIVGDLFESLIKRDAGAKDSAALVPAFGGVLDILDSPLLAAPVGFWMLVQ